MSWFSSSQPLNKETRKRTRQPITAAEIKRVLELGERWEAPYPQRYLGMGSILELECPFIMLEKIYQYWAPQPRVFDYYSCSYLDQGTLKGDLLQQFLFKAGVTYCNTTTSDKFVERPVILEDYGLKGRIDGILDFNKVKAFGSTKGPQEVPEDAKDRWVIMEAKETGDRNYSKWIFPEDLPEKYRCQASLYAHTLPQYEDKLVSFEDEVMFLIMNRESPRSIKTIFYKPEKDLVDRALKVSSEFWEHIRSRTKPEVTDKQLDPQRPEKEQLEFIKELPKDWDKFISNSIELHSNRNWVPASGLSQPKQKELF